MSKAMQWIGKHLSLGGLVRHAGSGIGTVMSISVHGAGLVASVVARDSETKKKIRGASKSVGNSLDTALTKASSLAGDGINYGVQTASGAVGKASGSVARVMGASEENVEVAKKVGAVIGAVAVGVVAGAGVADVAAAIGAAAGTAGGAAATSGIAALGGGSIAAGGGGMAAGHAVMQGIAAAGGVSGAATLKKDEIDLV